MNQEEIQQAAHEEKWVPKADRVKISTTNIRIDPSMTQKEETYQVVLDIIKNNTFFKAFLASADVPKIYMQQFWLSTFDQEFQEKSSLYLHLKKNYSTFSLDSDTREH
ncbi:hypothetical protein Tco_0802864 [Tanacetum coccineum]|uniref:Uncharacterized protein n=1 Tax=Tanacetum coccineum TaxID=301880 RepID=A0ABQ5A2P5_9ASTR